MALKYWAYIFFSPGFNPQEHTAELKSAECRYKTIGISLDKKEQVIEVAKQLVAEGVQMIELRGGFGPQWITKVSEAIKHAIPIGGVFYGPEARKPLLDVLTK